MRGARRSSGSGGQRFDEADLRRKVDRLKERHPISGIVGKAVKLKKSGGEYQGLCPFHSEKTPSFYVNDAKGFAHCFGCSWHGDQIRFVMDKDGCGFIEAVQRIDASDFPTWTPQERAKVQAEDRLADLEKEKDARRFYAESLPIAGTPGEAYLRARGITIAAPEVVRFGMVPSWRNKETGEWGRKRPAIICGAQDGTGAVVGIQRIFFKDDDARLGKKDCKLSLGTIKGSALRLAPPEATIIMAEGPEDGLSLMQEGPGLPVWVPFGTSMMPTVTLPAVVRKVIIAGQNNTAGRVAVSKAAIALAEQQLEVEYVWPAPTYDDWNDWLKATRQ